MGNQKIGFIGGGNMARSLIGGLVSDGYPASNIIVSDLDADKLTELSDKFGIANTQDSGELAANVDILVMAVKPQHIKVVCEGIKPAVQTKSPVIVSIAAGIRVSALARWLGNALAVVRCMPNTPALVKTGATGLYANEHVSDDQKDAVESLLRAVGITVWVSGEDKLDTVTALSGSGPAYFFLMMEASLMSENI